MFDDGSMKINGFIENIMFRNEENGYTVLVLDDGTASITVVGFFPEFSEGDFAEFTGRFTQHRAYGEQFSAESYERLMPQTVPDITKYLLSAAIPGVGPSTVRKITQKFKEQSLKIISEEPHRLSEISGISSKKADAIGQAYKSQVQGVEAIFFLQKYNLSYSLALRVYKKLGDDTVKLVKENPYILVQEVFGVGFAAADDLALNLGLSPLSPERICASAQYALSLAAYDGHSFLPKQKLFTYLYKILRRNNEDIKFSDDFIWSFVSNLVFEGKIIESGDKFYLPVFYFAEQNIAKKLQRLHESAFEITHTEVEMAFSTAVGSGGFRLSGKQYDAVTGLFESGLMIVTGGPGTGKTTLINTIISVLSELKLSFALAAPTGRAAKRMTDLCGFEAKTIHRLLEVFSAEDMLSFGRNEDNPLDFDAVIVDEMSMVDTLIFNSFLKAVKPGTLLVLVGDCDQLPSVGAGNVLQDIINCGKFKVVRLDKIFRRASESMITVNAHRINCGQMPVFNQKSSDFFFISKNSADDIVRTIISLCTERIPKHLGTSSFRQIQVISPTRKGPLGVTALNKALAGFLNPKFDENKFVKFGAVMFREGDKVMQIKNNYSLKWHDISGGEEGEGVFNGDVGVISTIDYKKEFVSVIFDDERLVEYGFSDLENLQLAYAVTVHKSQGSEFDAVIIPLYPLPPMLQSRNLLYTAVTRAKRLTVLVGREDCICAMVSGKNKSIRFTGLTDRLSELSSDSSIFSI